MIAAHSWHPIIGAGLGKLNPCRAEISRRTSELPHEIARVSAIVGEAKRVSSRAVKKQLPGTVWAAGGTYKPVITREHERKAYEYILYEQGPDAWTWAFLDGNMGGMFGREPDERAPGDPGRRCAGSALPRRGREARYRDPRAV